MKAIFIGIMELGASFEFLWMLSPPSTGGVISNMFDEGKKKNIKERDLGFMARDSA